MIITCPNCYTKYMVPAQKLGSIGRIVKCTKCDNKWHQEPPAQARADQPHTDRQFTPNTEGFATQGAGGAAPASATGSDGPFGRMGGYSPSNLPALPKDDHPNKQVWISAAASILVLIGLFLGVVLLKDPLVQSVPMMKAVFEPFETTAPTSKPSVAATGLTIENIERDIIEEDGFVTYIIQGQVTNTNMSEKQVPNLRVSLLNERGIQLDAWRVQPQKRALQPGESTGWICHFYNPPLAQVSEYRVDFAE